jgi:hypothetical protein
MSALTKAKSKYIAPIDERELAVRMMEAAIQIRRSPGKSAEDLLKDAPADWGPAFQRAARAAMAYWSECIEAANRAH